MHLTITMKLFFLFTGMLFFVNMYGQAIELASSENTENIKFKQKYVEDCSFTL